MRALRNMVGVDMRQQRHYENTETEACRTLYETGSNGKNEYFNHIVHDSKAKLHKNTLLFQFILPKFVVPLRH